MSHNINSEQYLNEILEILNGYLQTDKTELIASKNLIIAFDRIHFLRNHLSLKCKTLLYDFVEFSQIIPIQRKSGLFNLKVPFGDNDSYRAIVSPEGNILHGKILNYLESLHFFASNDINYLNVEYNSGRLIMEHRRGYGQRFKLNRPVVIVIPAFKLPLSQWPFSDPPVSSEVLQKFPWFYAIPWKNPKINDDCTFTTCAPEWENELLNKHPKSKKILCLMNRLRKMGDLQKLTYYMLKTVVLQQLSIVNWERDWISLLSEMWTLLVDHLRAGRLDSFLAYRLNLLDRMDSGELEECVTTTERILSKILEARYNNSKVDVEILFRIKLN